MNHPLNSKELREMKEQLALLNQKLQKQTIVNEKMLRRSMKEKAYSLRRNVIWESLVCFLMIPFFSMGIA